MSKRLRIRFMVVAIAVMAISVGWVAFRAFEKHEAAALVEKNMPTALAQHIERLHEAIPGVGGEKHLPAPTTGHATSRVRRLSVEFQQSQT